MINLALNTILLASNTTNTIITSPPGATIVPEPYHTANNPNFISNGAQWLWQSGGQSWPDGYTVSF